MRRSWVVLGSLIAATFLAGAASALPADKHLTLEGDNGQGCVSDQKVDCFRVVNGTLDGFVQGMRVHVTLENVGSAPHNAFVTSSADADSNHVDTPASAAINSSDTVEGGESTNLTFTVPSDADGLYFWCDVQGHEAGGMWLNATVSAPADDANGTDGTSPPPSGNGTDGDDGGDDESTIPGPGALLLTGAATLAAVARRQDRL